MRFPTLLLVPSLLVPSLALAQETTTASALTITTRDTQVAHGVLEMFDSTAELPALGDGKVAVLSLDDGGKVSVREGAGNDWLRIDARPAQLMEIFGAQVAQGRQMAQMMGGMALGQAGFEFGEIDEMVGAAFGFPKQLDALTITISNEYAPGTPMDVDVQLEPKAGTWFGTLVTNLQPLAAGAPALAGSDNAMVQMQTCFDVAKVLPQLLPIMGVFSGIGQKDKESKANAAKMMRTSMESYSGGMSVSFDAANGARAVAGLSDPAKMKSLMADPKYAEMAKAAGEANGMAEVTFEVAAMTHRDVAIAHQTVTYDDPQMAMFGKDGKMETFMAVAGSTMVMAMFGGAKAEIEALIDDALDQKIKSAPLADGAMMVAHLDVASLANMLEEKGMPADMEGAPATVGATLKKTPKGLRLQVKIQ